MVAKRNHAAVICGNEQLTDKPENKVMATHPLENTPWLLVTGQGRSGTTVLTKALADRKLIGILISGSLPGADRNFDFR